MSTPVNIVLAALGAQGVISALDGVRGSLGGLAATALGTTSALAGLQHGLDLGGEMADLSSRTTQGVRDLVVFRRSLDNAGVGSASAAQYIGLLQKAIAGLNEEGGATDGVFKRLGLDPAYLKQLGIKEQVDALTTGFARIPNPAERAALAMQLFGRSGAIMLQLLGDSTAMRVAEREAGRLGDRLQANAASFDETGDRLSVAKIRLQEFWVVAAEKALPTLRIMADLIEAINPAPLAAGLGSVLTIFGVVGGMKFIEKMNTWVWSFATNPAISGAGQAFAQKFLAPLTAGISTGLGAILPIAIASLVAGAIIQGVTQAFLERDAADIAAANAAARESQRQRDALRNAQSLADLDAQRKKTAEEIAALEKLASTQQIGTNTFYESENGRHGRAVRTPVYGLTPDQTQQLGELRRLQQTQASERAAALVSSNQQAAADAVKLTKAKEIVAELNKQAATYRESAETARYAVARDEEKLRLLDEQVVQAHAQYATDRSASRLAGDTAAFKAAGVKHEASLLAIAKERVTVEQSIATAKKQQAADAQAAAEKAKQAELELLRTKAEIAKFAAEDRQLQLQRDLSVLQADFGRTDAEKWADRRRLMTEAVSAAQAYLDIMKAQRASATTEEGRQLGDANVHAANQDLFSAQGQLDGIGPNPNSMVEQMRAGLAELRAEWGTTAQQVAGSFRGLIGSAVNSVSAGITGLIMRTTTWRDALRDIGTSILTTVISSIVQLGVRWVANQILMATMGKAIMAASIAATLPLAAASGAIWATPATLATIATAGGAAAAAPGEILLASMATKMQAIAGFERGGYTGEDGGWVHSREYVFSAPAVRNIGVDRLEAMHRGALSSSAAASPGPGGGAAGPSRDRRIIMVAPDMVSARQLARDPEFENVIVDVMRRRRGEVIDS